MPSPPRRTLALAVPFVWLSVTLTAILTLAPIQAGYPAGYPAGHLAGSAALRGDLASSAAAPITVTVRPVAAGFNLPIDIASAGDQRLFVAQQNGLIRIILDPETGSVAPTPFLTLTVSCCGEAGLLGLVFHPDYPTVPHFFVNYNVRHAGQLYTRIARFTAGSDTADITSEVILLELAQPRENHNAGDLNFGPDGYLYVGLGDGGGWGDPDGLAQDPATLLGKMLRLNVTGVPSYTVPADNPFVGDPAVRDEIWAFGLRNPWRFSFDRNSGNLFIADVGQDEWEEVSFEPAGSPGGLNFGWNCYEGAVLFPFPSPLCANPFTHTAPIHVYNHSAGRSITGGFVYRGSEFPFMNGHYFFADFVFSPMWTLTPVGGGGWAVTPLGNLVANPSTFGEGFDGALYVASYGGTIYELEESRTALPPLSTYAPVIGR